MQPSTWSNIHTHRSTSITKMRKKYQRPAKRSLCNIQWGNFTCEFERHNSKLTSLLSSSVWLWICCAMSWICRPKQSCPLTLKVFLLRKVYFRVLLRYIFVIICYWHLLSIFMCHLQDTISRLQTALLRYRFVINMAYEWVRIPRTFA